MLILVFIVEVFGISTNRAELLSITAESLRRVSVLSSTAESQALHDRVYFRLEYFSKLRKKY